MYLYLLYFLNTAPQLKPFHTDDKYFLSNIINTMIAYGLATLGARMLAAIVLTSFFNNISAFWYININDIAGTNGGQLP